MAIHSLRKIWWAIEDLRSPRRRASDFQLDWGDWEPDRKVDVPSHTADNNARTLELQRQMTAAFERITAVEAALAAEREAANNQAQGVRQSIDRSHGVLEAQMDRATAYFVQGISDVRDEAKRVEMASAEVRLAALELHDLAAQARQLITDAETRMPERAEQAVRAIIEQIEQEEGVLALALANVTSFTKQVSKTLERDQ